jgi:hypothetical protein
MPGATPSETLDLRYIPHVSLKGAGTMDDEKLGGKFWLALVGGAIACGIAAIVVLLFIGAAWARWGFFGMFLLLSAVLLGIGWIVDRREKRLRGSLG